MWGAVAYAVSRRGMQELLRRYWKSDWVPPSTPHHSAPLLNLATHPVSEMLLYSGPNT